MHMRTYTANGATEEGARGERSTWLMSAWTRALACFLLVPLVLLLVCACHLPPVTLLARAALLHAPAH